jgi:hypothetical protein
MVGLAQAGLIPKPFAGNLPPPLDSSLKGDSQNKRH